MIPDKLSSFGGYGVVKAPGLQQLLQYVCVNGHEHHVCFGFFGCERAASEVLRKCKG